MASAVKFVSMPHVWIEARAACFTTFDETPARFVYLKCRPRSTFVFMHAARLMTAPPPDDAATAAAGHSEGGLRAPDIMRALCCADTDRLLHHSGLYARSVSPRRRGMKRFRLYGYAKRHITRQPAGHAGAESTDFNDQVSAESSRAFE